MTEPALEALLKRDRGFVLGALIVIAGIAWIYVLWLAGQVAMPGLNMPNMAPTMAPTLGPSFKPWSVSDFLLTLLMWFTMMVGMMTPSAAPMILLYAQVGRSAYAQGKPYAATSWFFSGYLAMWVGFSLLATTAQWFLSKGAVLAAGETINNIFGGVILVAAGLYELTPLKNVCLSHCQSPLQFIQSNGGFKKNPADAFAFGLRHGAYCVGCCWALMTLLFVGGVMNILWIAGLAVFVLLEKLGVGGRFLPAAAGILMVITGVYLFYLGYA